MVMEVCSGVRVVLKGHWDMHLLSLMIKRDALDAIRALNCISSYFDRGFMYLGLKLWHFPIVVLLN